MDFDQLKKAISRFEEMLNAHKEDSAKRTELEEDAIGLYRTMSGESRDRWDAN